MIRVSIASSVSALTCCTAKVPVVCEKRCWTSCVSQGLSWNVLPHLNVCWAMAGAANDSAAAASSHRRRRAESSDFKGTPLQTHSEFERIMTEFTRPGTPRRGT